MRFALALILALLHNAQASAGDTGEQRNWFNDPFFQVRSADPTCPLPAGPYVDEQGRREQAHRRAEKGTTCWLAGQCDRPRAHLYDQDIAAALKQAFAASERFSDTALWVTVQGRVVYVEGCAKESMTAQEVETLVRSATYVEQAIAILRIGSSSTVPYRIRSPR